jgi:hypothetical protein
MNQLCRNTKKKLNVCGRSWYLQSLQQKLCFVNNKLMGAVELIKNNSANFLLVNLIGERTKIPKSVVVTLQIKLAQIENDVLL